MDTAWSHGTGRQAFVLRDSLYYYADSFIADVYINPEQSETTSAVIFISLIYVSSFVVEVKASEIVPAGEHFYQTATNMRQRVTMGLATLCASLGASTSSGTRRVGTLQQRMIRKIETCGMRSVAYHRKESS